MNFKSVDTDMLHGPLMKKLLMFALPVALSSILQQLFNAADTAVVGYFGDKNALAAVGTNTEIIALIVTVSSGLSVGANVLIAKLIGQNRKKDIATAVRTAVMLALVIGLFGLAIGQGAANPLLRLIQTPRAIFREASAYLRIYMLGYPFLLLYDFGSAVLRARGNSRFPFFALAVSGCANVVLNMFFVIVFRMGVAGVAAATDISNMLSALMVLRRLAKEPRSAHGRKFSVYDAAEIFKTGIPSAVQGAVFCFANIFVQASVNIFGEAAISGNTVAMNFEYFTYYIITAFGQTATTFTGQNHAAGKTDRCKKIMRLCLLLSIVCSSVPIYTVVFFRDFFSGLFSPDIAVTESAAVRIMCILMFEPVYCLYEIPAGVLRGSGHATYPAFVAVIGTCAFRIIWIFTVFRSNPTLPVLYHSFPISWVITVFLVNVGFLLSAYRRKATKNG